MCTEHRRQPFFTPLAQLLLEHSMASVSQKEKSGGGGGSRGWRRWRNTISPSPLCEYPLCPLPSKYVQCVASNINSSVFSSFSHSYPQFSKRVFLLLSPSSNPLPPTKKKFNSCRCCNLKIATVYYVVVGALAAVPACWPPRPRPQCIKRLNKKKRPLQPLQEKDPTK